VNGINCVRFAVALWVERHPTVEVDVVNSTTKALQARVERNRPTVNYENLYSQQMAESRNNKK